MRIRITPALVVSVLALFVALGDVANATMDLPWNSVGKEQLKWGAVDSSKVENRSLRAVDFAKGELPQGPRGERGPRGPRGEVGPRGPAGGTGASTGLTLRDAAGRELGMLLGESWRVGGGDLAQPFYVVLHDGGQYAYDGNEIKLSMFHRVYYARDDCTGTAYGNISASGGETPTEVSALLAKVSGQFRWVDEDPAGAGGVVAFKAGTTAQPVPAEVTEWYGMSSGVCADLGGVDHAPAWTVLVPVAAPIAVADPPLTVG